MRVGRKRFVGELIASLSSFRYTLQSVLFYRGPMKRVKSTQLELWTSESDLISSTNTWTFPRGQDWIFILLFLISLDTSLDGRCVLVPDFRRRDEQDKLLTFNNDPAASFLTRLSASLSAAETTRTHKRDKDSYTTVSEARWDKQFLFY